MKRKLGFIQNHSFPQTWNTVKYTYGNHRGTKLGYSPITLNFLITSRCNLRCNMCPQNSPRMPTPFLDSFPDITYHRFKQIIDRFRGAINLYLSGGEPFLHADVFDLIKYGHRLKMYIEVHTNGADLGGKINQIVDSHLDSLIISLDACNSKEYLIMHGASKGVFDTVIENIADLVNSRNQHKSKLELALHYICTKSNYRSVPDMIQLAEDLGVDKLIFCNLVTFGIPGFLEDQCLYKNDDEVINFFTSIEPPKSKMKVWLPKLYSRTTSERHCQFPFTTLTLNSNGDIAPCCIMPPLKDNGNVFHQKDVWNNKAFQKMRRTFLDTSQPLPPLCRTCNNRFSESQRLTWSH